MEKYTKENIFGVFSKLTKKSRPINNKFVDTQAFDFFLNSIGIPTLNLKERKADVEFLAEKQLAEQKNKAKFFKVQEEEKQGG